MRRHLTFDAGLTSQFEQHARAAVTMDVVLGEYELVHAGPVKAFHDRVLVEVGLL